MEHYFGLNAFVETIAILVPAVIAILYSTRIVEAIERMMGKNRVAAPETNSKTVDS
jgi:hypothetical protein